MSTFAELNLSNDALKAVERLEYTCPTPVQEQAIPIVLEGRDLIAAASTGTGKTAAFLLPVLSTLPRAGRGKRAPRVLVVTPTRELAQQISTTCIKIARATGHFVSTVYGGTPYSNQIRELRGGVDVLIATPGRLKDLMARGVVDLSCISTLVLDEADRMLDMGFLPDVTTIVDETPEDRQTLLFSATIDQSIKNNLGSLLRDPAIVQIAHKGETAKTVEQFVMPIAQRDKADLLQAVLKEKGSTRVIVFARTKNRTEDCAEMLCDAGFSAESIHSDKSQGQRRRALENFRRGRTDILVATDVLARGIDVTGVDHVINYDLPDMPEDYVHRIGRTGRAGEAGYAISFVSPDTRRLLRDVEHLINREIPFMELESYELDPSILKQGGKGQGAGKSKRSGGYTGKRSGGYTGKSSGGFAGKSSGGHRGGKGAGGYGGSKNASRTGGKREGGYAGKANGYAGKREGGYAGKNAGSQAGSRNGGASFEGRSARTSSGTREEGTGYRNKGAEGQKYAGKRFDDQKHAGKRANAASHDGRAKGGKPYGEDRGKRADNRSNGYQGGKNATGQHQKNRTASISDVRSFGEHKKRVRSKRAALEME